MSGGTRTERAAVDRDPESHADTLKQGRRLHNLDIPFYSGAKGFHLEGNLLGCSMGIDLAHDLLRDIIFPAAYEDTRCQSTRQMTERDDGIMVLYSRDSGRKLNRPV